MIARLTISLIILISCAPVFAQDISDDFFLAQYTTRDINNRLRISLTPVDICMDVAAYEALPRILPLSLIAITTKPFSVRRPLSEQIGVSAYHIGRFFSAGLRLKTAAQLTRFTYEAPDRTSTGLYEPDPITQEISNHTRTDLSATGNIMFRAGVFMFTLAASGNLISNSGYDLSKLRNNYYSGYDYHLYEYEPKDRSMSVSGGILISVPNKLLGCPLLNWVQVHGLYANEHLPVHAQSADIVLEGYDRFFWYGSRKSMQEGSWCLATQPLKPDDRTRETMLYKGHFIHGIRIEEVSIQFNNSYSEINNVKYSSRTGYDTARTSSWHSHYKNSFYALNISPEFYLTPWFSCGMVLTGTDDNRVNVNVGIEHQRQSQTNVSGSLRVNLYRQLSTGTQLTIQLGTGDIAIPVTLPNRVGSAATFHYRHYLLALNITLLGLR